MAVFAGAGWLSESRIIDRADPDSGSQKLLRRLACGVAEIRSSFVASSHDARSSPRSASRESGSSTVASEVT